ncbi:alpha/beta fold hydrolase [Saccharopolyspora sp. TS4A08]|uniref:Alpha/beta fold hydrolase n=1 Tax=Saccharopolyspora ipomoeae TaxID=3042027 RepID=A0ABT6PMB6_9PSEU|nr:alpha/beta fold hydrolase [Saccharopolyspora sp. TS4A08]MDI2029151.1 alpha/beta fold hydrolase [Saccharopolyspora sp. TS4A08]
MSGKSGRARRIWAAIGVTAVAVLVAAAVLLRAPSPVGHWNSREGHSAFMADYGLAWQAMPPPARVLDVRTGFGVVRVYRFDGTGPTRAQHPFVLLPGRSSPSPAWADNMPSLLGLGDVYVVDLLGEPGLSVQEVPIEDAADNAAWLDQTLAALPEERFSLLGLSIGGWTATNLALHFPQRVASLVLIDPAHTFGGIPLGTAIRAIPASVPWLPKAWRDSFASYTAGGAPVGDEPIARMTETAMRAYTIRLPQPSLFPERDLAALDAPVLAVLAGRSVMHDTAAAAEVAERTLRRGRVVVYPEASHAVGSEEAEAIAAEIGRFLAEQR